MHQVADQTEQVARIQHSLAVATRGVQLQERMIQDLLDDACIQAHHLELSLNPCDLLTLVKETVTKQQQSALMHTLILEIPRSRRRIPIMADADRITQVLNRYIENALASSDLQQPVIVRVSNEGAMARVSVYNEGETIPIEEQERIWTRSYQAKGSSVQYTTALSFGLGLYLCQVFIERHHGSVGVQSNPGQGTTFWFTLPLVRASQNLL